MKEQEVIELLKAAKPLVQNRFFPRPNPTEKKALLHLESILRQTNYDLNLIFRGGWTLLEVTVLKEKLDNYGSKKRIRRNSPIKARTDVFRVWASLDASG